ncbi:MAG: sulfurtransferase complex subunit TusD [Pseudomonadales bacterium]|nr:sulfurtransferase complex subunit TusD [Pseudomonadales bacterium]
MNFAIAVYAAPYSHQSPDTAYQFALAALNAGHSITRIFFYHSGVFNASGLSIPPQDEINIIERWAQLSKKFDVELAVCIAAALKRGIIDEAESRRYELTQHNIHPAFQIVGLGQWVDAMITADRVLVFGP